MKNLGRDEFRRVTLDALDGRCAVPECFARAVDAHHILNRNLWTGEDEEGGYFLENGAPLCGPHHLEAELTLISVKDLWRFLNREPFLPATFDAALEYDTWGNVIVNEWQRSPGPMFDDSGCQRALDRAGVLWKFH